MNDSVAVVKKVEESVLARKVEFEALSPFHGWKVSSALAEFRLYAAMKPDILQCSPASLMTSLMRVVQTGLMLGKTAYVVPFDTKRGGKVAVFVADYRGLIELACTGKVRVINAGVARKGDDFKYELGSTPWVRHVPVGGNSNEVTYAWAAAQVGLHAHVVMVLDRRQLAERKRDYANPEVRKEELEAVTWWCRKTAIRDLCNLLPMNPRLAAAMQYDEVVDEDDPTPDPTPYIPKGREDDGVQGPNGVQTPLGVQGGYGPRGEVDRPGPTTAEASVVKVTCPSCQATVMEGLPRCPNCDALFGQRPKPPETEPVAEPTPAGPTEPPFTRETVWPLGKHAGTKIRDLDQDFLDWAVKPDRKFGKWTAEWQEVMVQELEQRREEKDDFDKPHRSLSTNDGLELPL